MQLDDKLVDELRANEQIVQIVSLDELAQAWELKRGALKTGVGYASPIMDATLAAKLLSEFGVTAHRVLLRSYAGRQYVIFKGLAGQRRIFTGTRYLAGNPKVVRMAIGPAGVVKSVKGGFVLTAVLCSAVNVFDYFIRDSATLHELLGTLSSDLIKIGLSAIAAAVAGLAVGSAAVIGSVAAAPLIAAIAVGVATGLVLDELDKRFGATQALIDAYANVGIRLGEIKWEIKRNLDFLERNPQFIPCLFGPCSVVRGY